MKVQKQVETFKENLHKDLDEFFKTDKDSSMTTEQFKRLTELFLKRYYNSCKETSDFIFENDNSIARHHKRKHKQFRQKDGKNFYDEKVMPLLETVNMLSSPGAHDYKEFSIILAESIKFLFSCYTIVYSIHLPSWANELTDPKNPSDSAFELKKILSSMGEDLVRCFKNADIEAKLKVPMTMLFGSELQDRLCMKVADYIAAEEIALKIAKKVMGDNDELDLNIILDSLKETHKVMTDQYDEMGQLAYYRLLKIMSDLFTGNLESHIVGSPLKPNYLTTETRMKIIDLKNSLVRDIEKNFDRIK